LAAQQGSYVVGQLDSLAGQYMTRVSGTDNGQPPSVNGHDEFAAAWLAEIQNDLSGIPVGVLTQTFPTAGSC
jgi:hypothetical protein